MLFTAIFACSSSKNNLNKQKNGLAKIKSHPVLQVIKIKLTCTNTIKYP